MLVLANSGHAGLYLEPPIDRRTAQRFPVELEVRYKLVDVGGSHTGMSKTINMSSSGLLLAGGIAAAAGRPLELSIHWPAHLDGKCGLQLVVSGRVIWCDGTRIGIRTDRKPEFRTMGAKTWLRSLRGRETINPGQCPELAEPDRASPWPV